MQEKLLRRQNQLTHNLITKMTALEILITATLASNVSDDDLAPKITSVTKDEFKVYKCIKELKATSMWNTGKVIELSEGILNEAKCVYIMNHYEALKRKHK